MRVPRALAMIATVACLTVALSACGSSGGGDDSRGTAETQNAAGTPGAYTSSPGLQRAIDAARAYTPGPEEIETPVAQAEESGITPYWFGDEFNYEGHLYLWERNLNYGDGSTVELPSVGIRYSGTPGAGDPSVRTFPPNETLDNRRLTWEGSASEPVEFDDWTGEAVWVVDNRGLLRVSVLLFSDAAAVHVSTGLTSDSEDSEGPLNDLDTLLAIIEDNLRPFPE